MTDVTELLIRIETLEVKEAQRELDKLTKQSSKAEKAGKALGNVFKVGVAAGLAAVTAQGVKSIAMLVKFDKKMKEVSSIAGVSNKRMKELRKEVLQLSTSMGVDATDAAGALYQALSAGVPQENAIQFLATSSQLAIAGVTDTAVAVDGLTNVINAYGLNAREAGNVSDDLFTTVKLGKTTVEELSRTMANATVPAAALGVSYQEVLAATVSLTKQGVATAEAMTKQKALFTSLSKPSDTLARKYKAMGIESGKAGIAAFGLVGFMNKLNDAFDGNDNEIQKALGSSDSYMGMLALVGEKGQEASKALAELGNNAGAAMKAAEVNANTLENSMTRLNSASTQFMENLENRFGFLEASATFIAGIARDIGNGESYRAEAIINQTADQSPTSILMMEEEIVKLKIQKANLAKVDAEDRKQVLIDLEKLEKAYANIDRDKIAVATRLEALNSAAEMHRRHETEATARILNARRDEYRLAQENLPLLEAQENVMEKQAEYLEQHAAFGADAAIQAKLELDEARELLGVLQKQTQEKGKQTEIGAGVSSKYGVPDLLRRPTSISSPVSSSSGGYAQQDPSAQQLSVMLGLGSEEDQINDRFLRDRELILENTRITEEERTELELELAERRNQQLEALEGAKSSIILDSASKTFDGLAGLALLAGDQQSAAYKTLFGISKGFAIAEAALNVQRAIGSAFASGITPWDRAAQVAIAATEGGRIISSISSIQGAFEHGGMINSGNYGIVGESGAEIVKGPAVVTSARTTAGKATASGASGAMTVNIHNSVSDVADVQATQSADGKTVQIAVTRAKSEIHDEIQRGYGIGRAIQDNFNTERR